MFLKTRFVNGRKGMMCMTAVPYHILSIYYFLSEIEQQIIKSVRESTWIPLDEIDEIAQQLTSSASRSAVYRTLCAAGLNRVP